MEKGLDQLGKKGNKDNKQVGSTDPSKDHHQQNEKIITDKISEDRIVGGLTERDDAPGSGIDTDPTEHTMGNP